MDVSTSSACIMCIISAGLTISYKWNEYLTMARFFISAPVCRYQCVHTNIISNSSVYKY